MSCLRSFFDNKWPSINFYQMYFGKIRGVGNGGIHPLITLNLKSALELLITSPVSPCGSLYDHSFYIYLIYPQGIIYNPCPEGSGKVFIPKDIISEPLKCVEQNEYITIWIGRVVRNGGCGREGVSCPLVTVDY